MFDCPEHSHTSPIITLCSVTGVPSLMVISYGPPALGVATLTSHLPSLPATASYLCLSHDVVTLTVRPASHVPHSGASAFCCITM